MNVPAVDADAAEPAPVTTREARREHPRLGYMPALDGVRALAVVAVMLSHGGFRWARGGFLGVTTFFVLSGFLICGLLLVERDTTSAINLRAFWARRARRLVPGVLVLVAIIAGYYLVTMSHPARGVVGDAIAAMSWIANWRFVFAHRSYADLFAQVSPFQHTWSLAVEEQFYLVAPLAVVALLGWRGAKPRRWALATVVVIGIALSTLAAAMLHPAGSAPGRAYFGTDARAAEPLVGV